MSGVSFPWSVAKLPSTPSPAPVSYNCPTRLEWDPSPGATEYYVYRAIVYGPYPYFYDTQRVVAADKCNAVSCSYDEIGNDFPGYEGTDPNYVCGFKWLHTQGYLNPCHTGLLEAYYVTARNANTSSGESPRSNMVFWNCEGTPYAKMQGDTNAADAIASLGLQAPRETLACWITDGPDPRQLDTAVESQPDTTRPTLAIYPMRSLGELDPTWVVLDLHTDHLGTVRLITNTIGGQVSRHNYFPFGDEITDPPPASYNTHQYTGHERDRETGLDYMLARYYEAGLGRFVSFDTSRKGSDGKRPQSWNGYTYVTNNPMGKIDPNGLYEQNFHEGTTYMLAKQAGYSESEARTIARADNGVDSGRTNPFICGPALRTQWHGFDADRKALETTALNAKTLGGLGTALHPYQDSFAHQNFPASTGHLTSGHTPDKTSSAPNKAVLAGMGTYDILKSSAAQSGKSGFGAPDTGLLKSLADTDANVTSYDPASKGISVEVEGEENANKLAGDLKARGYTVEIIKK